MNNIDLQTIPSGFPLTADGTLDFMQQSYLAGIRALAGMAGNVPVIVSGLNRFGNNYVDGWIFIDDDLIFFQGGSGLSTFIIEETAVEAANSDGTMVERYITKKARFGTGTGQRNFSLLKRANNLIQQQAQIAQIMNFEPAVILDGCVVFSVTGTTNGTLSISGGTYVIDNQVIAENDGYTGAFPVYFNVAEGYTTSQPTSGSYVTFNPQTSQRKADVLARATTKIGEIKDIAVLPSEFDSATGLGRWAWKGFAICNGSNGTLDLRGRTKMSYDPRTTNPDNDIWDFGYTTPGATGGEKEVALTLNQMPIHNHTGTNDNLAQGEFGLIRKSSAGENKTASNTDTSQSGTEPDIITEPAGIPAEGNNEAHENRAPFIVLVTVQRIA